MGALFSALGLQFKLTPSAAEVEAEEQEAIAAAER
jgi:hypothetical protein